MKNRLLKYTIVLAIVLEVGSTVPRSAAQSAPPNGAQATTPSVAQSTPRMTDGHPDLSGFWVRGIAGVPGYGKEPLGHASNLLQTADGSFFLNYGGGVQPENPSAVPRPAAPPARSSPSYKPEYAAKVKAIMDTMYGNATSLDPMQACKPLGVPRAGLGIDEHLMIVQNPKAAAFMWEADPGPIYRVIYLDGRQHPQDLDTSYMGDSIGHWDGDVLVVDVVGLNDETWLGSGNQGPRDATLHSDKEHVLEHWTRTGDDITYEATVEDPVMFTKPWVMTPQRSHIAAPGDYIQPTMCVNNDRTHLIKPTEQDQYRCDFCVTNPGALYGPGTSSNQK